MINRATIDFVNYINLATKDKLKYVYVPCNERTISLLWLLYDQGCIMRFVIKRPTPLSKPKIQIFLIYYLNRPLIKRFELISKPSARISWTFNKLFSNFGKFAFNGVYVVSTSKGVFLSNDLLFFDVFKSNMSGEVLFRIIF